MSKTNFKFNDKTLEYDKVETTLLARLKKAGLHIGVSLGLALVFIVASYPIVTRYIAKDQLASQEKLKQEYNVMNERVGVLAQELSVLRLRDDSVYADIFGVAPISKNLRIGGSGGTDEFKSFNGYENKEIMLKSAKLIALLNDQISIHKSGFDRITKLAHTRSEKLAHVPAIQPIHNHNLIRTASGFGMRMHPVYGVLKLHTGVDFTAKKGTEIFASGDGVVFNVKKSYTGYGQHVIIDHGFGYKTLYAHMSAFKVKKGQKVKRGDVIGLVGNTGTSTGAHLHYEVIRDGKKIDPANFFFNDLDYDQYKEMIEISSKINTSLD